MSAKVYAVKRSDGGVTIMVLPAIGAQINGKNYPARSSGNTLYVQAPEKFDDSRDKLIFATVESCISKWPEDQRANVESFHEIDPATCPQDRTFRNAWHFDNGVKVHMGRALEIAKHRVRAVRAPRLKALDVEVARASRAMDETALKAANDKFPALLDATADPRLTGATTPEALKAAMLAICSEMA